MSKNKNNNDEEDIVQFIPPDLEEVEAEAEAAAPGPEGPEQQGPELAPWPPPSIAERLAMTPFIPPPPINWNEDDVDAEVLEAERRRKSRKVWNGTEWVKRKIPKYGPRVPKPYVPALPTIVVDPAELEPLGPKPILPGYLLTCRKCGKTWKARKAGLKPCPACGDREWWHEFTMEDYQAIEQRLAAEANGDGLKVSPSTGLVHCRLVLEVYHPGSGTTEVGIYKKLGAGWPMGQGLGVVKFRVDGQEELKEVMEVVQGVVNGAMQSREAEMVVDDDDEDDEDDDDGDEVEVTQEDLHA